jgi:hypothetical protein
MRRTAKIGIGAGVLAGLVGARKARAGRRNDQARTRAADSWPEVPVKPGATASIDAERASDASPAAGEDG